MIIYNIKLIKNNCSFLFKLKHKCDFNYKTKLFINRNILKPCIILIGQSRAFCLECRNDCGDGHLSI
ncbi:hypothetical protein QTP88_012236 [Uroleucon formosanum]